MAERNTFRVAIRKFDPFGSAIQNAWESFQEQAQTHLALEAVQLDLHPLYQTLFGDEGLKRGEWDVAFINTDWFAAAHAEDAVLDLAPRIATNPPQGYPEAWTPSLRHFQQFGDAIIGLPYHDGPECLIYRKDLFEDPAEQAAYRERYSRPLRPPRTWDEFHNIARFFHRPDQNLYGTVFAAYPDGHNTVYDFSLQVWTRGGELLNETGTLDLNTQAAIEGLEFYRTILNDATAMHPKAREYDSVQAGLAFARGEIAMMQNWFGFAGMAETIPESRVKGKVDIAEIPRGEAGDHASLNVYWILCIGAGSPHQDLAYRFLRHCASPAMDKMLTLAGGIGCRRSTWQDGQVNATIPFYHRLETLHRNARELPRLTNWAGLAGVIDELVLETIDGERPIAQIAAEKQDKLNALDRGKR